MDMLTECGALKSKGEARRAIEAGGIYLNNHRIADTSLKVSLEDAIEHALIILRRWRKNYWLIRIEE